MSRRRFSSRKEWAEHRKQLVAEWFPSHVAEFTKATVGGITVERLVWRKPKSSINRIDYVCDGPHLFVTGDLGDAIYETGAIDLDWWSRCDVWYFASKCVASENGRGYKEWDADAALLNVRDLFEFNEEEGATTWNTFVELGGEGALSSRGEWEEFVRDNADEIWGDSWTDIEPWNVGSVISLRCEGHLAGLKLALAQIANAERAA